MARGTQSSLRTRPTTSTTRVTILTSFTTLLLLLATSFASLPVPAVGKGVYQGCSLHLQEKLVSCKGVNLTQLQDFLQQVTTSTNSTPTTPNDSIFTTTTTTTAAPPQADNTTITNTTTVANTESSMNVDSNARNKSNSRGSNIEGTARITELSCVGCLIPELTQTFLLTIPTTLERLSIVDSGLQEILPDTLTSHALTLVHLDLSYNLLQKVPEAVVALTRLQALDLRHNDIHQVPEGTVLTSMRGLRYLYLDHNQLGQTFSSSQGQRSHPSVFDLWAAAKDTPLPLPRLSHLGLSFNGIKEVPNGAFSRIPNLLHLDLGHNLLTSLRQSDLPASILNLDLGGNPWNCTCEAAWIIERQGSLSTTTTTTTAAAAAAAATAAAATTTNIAPTTVTTTTTTTSTITIISPTCFSPLHLRRRRLDFLRASEVCPPKETASGDQVVYIGDDVEGPLRDAFTALRLLNATSLTTHALLISWRVDATFYSLSAPPLQHLSWGVTVRDVTQDPREAHLTRLKLDRYRRETPHWTPGDGLFTEVLEGLDADTTYIICLTVVQRRRLYTRPGHCLHSTTFSKQSMAPRTTSPAATAPEALQSYSTLDYDIRTEAFTVWTEPHTASLSWNVTVLPRDGRARELVSHENPPLRPLGWRVSYRRSGEDEEGDDEEVEIVLVSRGGESPQNFTNSYSIEGLQAGARYAFCLHTLTNEEVKEALAEGDSESPLQDMSPLPQPVSSLPWEADSHTLPTTARGRSVVDSRGGAARQDLVTNGDALSGVLPAFTHPNEAASPAHSLTHPNKAAPSPHSLPTSSNNAPSAHSATSAHTSPIDALPFNVPATPSNQVFGHSFPAQPPSIPASSGFPAVPPSLPPLPQSRPPRPPQPQPGGGFVYTSSGKRIPLPSGAPAGLLPPFNVPPPIPIRDPGPPRGLRGVPSPSPSQSPSRQRFIYEFQDTPSVPSSPPPAPPTLSSGLRTQVFTYQTRRKRAVEGRKPSPFIKSTPLCRQVVTPVELDVILPAAIAATISCAATVVVVLLVCCCCWPRRCCRRKGAWRSRSLHDSRKVSTISSPSPVTVFSGHTSVVATAAAAGTGKNDEDETSPRGADRAGRSVSTTSSSGYLTPLQSPEDRGTQNGNADPKAAYLSLMQSSLLQRHKDLPPEFHPGYDIPPTASNKTLVGYDYPHPTPINASAASSPQLPSPSSSDSNYNVSIGNISEPDRNLNIPCQNLKSSGLTKSVHIPPDVTDNSNYIYTAEGQPTTTAARTYLKHPPSKTRHRKFAQPQQGAAAHNNTSQSQSSSTPKLLTAPATTDEEEPASLNPSLTNGPSPTMSLVSEPSTLPLEAQGYINFPAVQKYQEASIPQKQPVNGGSSSSSSKERESYHTWAGHTAKARPSVSEVVLSGGTLIEVPEGYVVPKSPKPTPFIRLLVRGQDGPQNKALKTPPSSPPAHDEGGGSANDSVQGNSETRRLNPATDHNRLVINTAVAL